MNYDSILLRFGELTLKGVNRGQFEDKLKKNIKRILRQFPEIKIHKTYGRMYVQLNGTPYEPVLNQLKKVFGIVSFSPTKRVEQDVTEIQKGSLDVFLDVSPRPTTFKVSVRRADKRFPIPSQEMNHIVGGYILKNCKGLKVDVHHPDAVIYIEIRDEGVYISCQSIPGLGGLPLGTSGKAMLMLSGGIDSPVAGWLTMKRGVPIEGVHFHSYPFTSERAKQKVIDLSRVLSQYSGEMKLHIVPFTEIQTQIRQHVPDDLSITIMRRMMMRITQGLANQRKALAISTGESLGQVASQTLESMNTINKVVDIPVLRPLIAMDKQEIIKLARQIGTYETSILPYEDCCTIFMPKSPRTRPNPQVAERFEKRLDVDLLVEKAVADTEMMVIKPKSDEKEMSFF
ncbi:tRNA 4-thiouridine(8) synthase ThiI [Microaerobacter geothermalis]|uniref:tRNA uracil 4-sulfurtransferase ThiI n=1 Tax=Microaerobacter geothermalis TaxID=674972 RepID=UPI001F30AD36|nr:tRNA uracil 4-sulfurtransferase ThiI [Microaerobacter geothermalis]MCF6094996.1 tRNA 4-thiouridine(8) synthase ThiI [Microaerobacter geothermalis]